MKIAIISTYPPQKCGIGIYTKYLADSFHKNMLHEVEIITFKGYDYNDKRAKPILVKSNPFSYLKVISYLQKNNFDAVFIQHEYILYNYLLFPLFLMSIQLEGIKVNMIMHTVAYYKGFWKLAFSLYHEFMLLFVDTLFLHTKIAERKLNERTMFKKRAIIIPHPIPTKDRNFRKPSRKKSYNLLCFGFIDYIKGFDIVARAVGNNKKYNLRIVGSSVPAFADKQKRYVEYIKYMAKSYRNVKTEIGFVSEEKKNKLFKEADFVLLPYRQIEQSGILCDAWSYGKIPVCSDIGPFRKEAGTKYGVLFGKNNEDDLKYQLDELIKERGRQKEILGNIHKLVNKRSYDTLAYKFLEAIQ